MMSDILSLFLRVVIPPIERDADGEIRLTSLLLRVVLRVILFIVLFVVVVLAVPYLSMRI